jgi:hypothetical protein
MSSYGAAIARNASAVGALDAARAAPSSWSGGGAARGRWQWLKVQKSSSSTGGAVSKASFTTGVVCLHPKASFTTLNRVLTQCYDAL